MSRERTTRPRSKLIVSAAMLAVALTAGACATSGSMDEGIQPPPSDTLTMPTDTMELRL